MVLHAWHAGWLLRQHQVILAVLHMYCSKVAKVLVPHELQPHLLLEGAADTAHTRQLLAEDVAAVDVPVVLDSSAVVDGEWLGTWALAPASAPPRCASIQQQKTQQRQTRV